MALPARPLRPHLTVIPGGRRRITVDLDKVEEGWVEVQAVAHDAEVLAGLTLQTARAIQLAIAGQRPALAGQYAHQLELVAPLHYTRARRAELGAKLALEGLHPEPVA